MNKNIPSTFIAIVFILWMHSSFAQSLKSININAAVLTAIIDFPKDSLGIDQSKDVIPFCEIKKSDTLRNKKLISALLAFPFPLGFVGAHRVMLGTKPWIPIVYVTTLGGCFGLLPLIDFCVIVFSKNIEQYENNPRIFMWIK